ncbi:hypothetical protein E2C01_002860 [Portunus trituberculatus]|uniref:Uncharacterized protein n=1 Tax=Portunus trituberculatus TaxID=210409 RepID=A0A5B7CMC7_PORTR|nr:hypothetical protein [Portunus trituberculatus]
MPGHWFGSDRYRDGNAPTGEARIWCSKVAQKVGHKLISKVAPISGLQYPPEQPATVARDRGLAVDSISVSVVSRIRGTCIKETL